MIPVLLLLASLARAAPHGPASPPAAGPEAVASYLAQAADPDLPEAARMAAFNQLVTLGATDLSGLVAAARQTDGVARERWVAVRVLGQVGGAQARTVLLDLLADPMPAMRAAAAQALGDTADPTVTGQVVPLLRDEAIIVRAAAAKALGKLRDPSAIPALSEALDASDNYYRGSSLWVRHYYVQALGQIGDPQALPALLRALDDADDTVVNEALAALEALSGTSFADGRTRDEQREAWRRWITARLK